MRIKNTTELRVRARSHAANDHVIQGTYGIGVLNGHAEFRGCAIGCLSTPHREADLRQYLSEFLNTKYGPTNRIDGVDFYGVFDEDSGQRQKLEDEFGMTKHLIIAAEGFFEAQPTHGAAINFVRDFATALPEGAEITNDMIDAWLRNNVELEWDSLHDEFFDYSEITEPLRYDGKEATEKRTEEFLDFLSSIPVAQEQLV